MVRNAPVDSDDDFAAIPRRRQDDGKQTLKDVLHTFPLPCPLPLVFLVSQFWHFNSDQGGIYYYLLNGIFIMLRLAILILLGWHFY